LGKTSSFLEAGWTLDRIIGKEEIWIVGGLSGVSNIRGTSR